jgi:hypothetical protein
VGSYQLTRYLRTVETESAIFEAQWKNETTIKVTQGFLNVTHKVEEVITVVILKGI